VRIPALDGLRGISIGLVLLAHVSGMDGFPIAVTNSWITKLGLFGVEIFFCISGFVITYLLLAEKARTGSVSLRRFYTRRIIRIVPAYYLFVAFIATLGTMVPIYLPVSSIWAALSFTTNVWLSAGTWYLGHTWSLAVEEQFYLLWPFTLVVLFRWPIRRTVRLLTYVLAASVPISILCKLAVIPAWIAGFVGPIFPIYAGCLLAILFHFHESELRAFYERRTARCILVVSLAAAIVLSAGYSAGRFALVTVPARELVVSFAVAFLVGYAVLHRGWLQRALNTRALVFLGTISYSLYLWQQVFLTNDRTEWDQALGAWPQRLLFAVAVAVASFYLIERPMWKLRDRLRP